MSLLRNLLGNFMPHFEARRSTAVLNAVNAELVHDLNGDASAVVNLFINQATLQYHVEGSADGTNYFALLCYPYANGSTVAAPTNQQPAQPIVTEVLSGVTVMRVLCTAVSGLQKIRVRLSTYTAGSCTATINSDANPSLHPYVNGLKASTLMVSTVAAVGASVTATLPIALGLRHYVDRIDVTRCATNGLTQAGTPVVISVINLPGNPQLSMGADAGGVGIDKSLSIDFGASGMAATAAGTATTITCPAYVNVMWRVNVAYRLGM